MTGHLGGAPFGENALITVPLERRCLNERSEGYNSGHDKENSVLSVRYLRRSGTGLLFVYFHRTSTAVMAPLVSAFNIAPTALGLFGSMYFYAYALGQLPAGIMADRWVPGKPCLCSY